MVVEYLHMNLSVRLRPKSLNEYVGQEQLVGEGHIIRKMIDSQTISSMIFWGPPGTGKTTLASIISREVQADFHTLSGVTSGKDDLRKIVEIAKENQQIGRKTVLFIDEIHRWNKAQQDTLLPHVESGLIILIGATTENPSFEVISALLSRSRVFVLESLTYDELETILNRALSVLKKEDKKTVKIEKEAEELLIRFSGGDARILLNALEMAVAHGDDKPLTSQLIEDVFQTKSAGLYDKKADEHYNTISSYIKSMRASNVDAALYYLARMVEGGEDPKFIARRMVIFASEDIGVAVPTAIVVANEVFKAVEVIGYPECAINLAHGTVYLATCKKDRSAYNAYIEARGDVQKWGSLPIPLHLRNAPTKLMKELGYAKDYKWSDDYVGPAKDLSFLPDKLKDRKYYKPKH